MKKLANISKIALLLCVKISINFFTCTTYAESTNESTVISGGITGQVIDPVDNEKIPYATIALFKADTESLINGTITDDEGEFILERVPEGEYFMEVNFLGYNKEVINDIFISSEAGGLNLGKITLERAFETLEGVEVSAERSALEYRLDRRVVNIDRNLQAAGGTVVEALENLPSIQTDAEGNILLRGSSSYTVLIDGRPSPLSGSEALRQIPAGAVEQVEIITNPSARYDPDGSAGIINIIMKKEYQNGFNGLVNMSAGSTWKRSGDFSFNYRRNRLNYFFSGRYAERPRNTSSELFNEIDFDNNTRLLHQYSARIENNDPYAISGGIDYHINDKNVLTFTGEYGHWGWGIDMDSDVNEEYNSTGLFINKHTLTEGKMGGNYLNGRLNFDHKSSNDNKWESSLFVSTWDGNNTLFVNETTLDDSGQSELFSNKHRTGLKADNYEVRFRSDFSKSFSETSKFEAGYQYRLKDETGSFRLYNFIESSDNWIENMDFHNNVLYIRHIHSLYGTYSGELAGFQYQGGLRAEYTDRKLSSDKDYLYDKLDFFPTVHITRQLPNNQQLQTSYSRRINRPEMWSLNPSPSYMDNYMMEVGNPELVPQITNSYELNYMWFNKVGFLSAEAYYRHNKNSFTTDLTLQQDGRMRITNINLGSSLAYGVELSSNLTLSEYFNTFLSANLYNYTIDNEYISENIDNSMFRSDFTLNANIMPIKNTRLQVTGFYRSPSVTHQGRASGFYGVNLALNQDFMERQLSVTLSVRDVFKTMAYSFEATGQESKTNYTYNMEQQVFMLSLRYRINNYQNNRHREDVAPQGGGGMF